MTTKNEERLVECYINRLEREKKGLQNQVEELGKKLSALRFDLKAQPVYKVIAEEVERTGSSAAVVASIKAAKLQTRVEELEKANSDAVDQVNHLTGEETRLLEALSGAQSIISQHEDRIKELETETEPFAQVSKKLCFEENKQLKSELEKARTRITELEADVERWKKKFREKIYFYET